MEPSSLDASTSLSGKIALCGTNLNPPELLTQSEFDALCTASALQELRIDSPKPESAANFFILQAYQEPYLDCRYISILGRKKDGNWHFECLVDSFKKQ